MCGPDPRAVHPLAHTDQVSFINNTLTRPNIEVGDFSYYDDPDRPRGFEDNVLYHFSFLGDRLVIGKFCAIAKDVRFIMNGANHQMNGPSTYPFQIFGHGWEKVMPGLDDLPLRGDTVVGHDVWIGYDALVMPGVHIGDGAIVAARSVVVADVEPYTVVGGNPARLVKGRFSRSDAAELQRIAWWDWPIETITEHLEIIAAGSVADLRRIAR